MIYNCTVNQNDTVNDQWLNAVITRHVTNDEGPGHLAMVLCADLKVCVAQMRLRGCDWGLEY